MCKLHPLMKNEMVLAVSSSKRAVMMLSLVLSLENKKNVFVLCNPTGWQE